MAHDYTSKNDTDLVALLKDARQALHAFRFGTAGSKGRNVREGRNARKSIARYLTELRKREA
jgi:ribosomal protein L29